MYIPKKEIENIHEEPLKTHMISLTSIFEK